MQDDHDAIIAEETKQREELEEEEDECWQNWLKRLVRGVPTGQGRADLAHAIREEIERLESEVDRLNRMSGLKGQ